MPALQSWADDVENNDFPPRTETTDKDGITTIVEYRLNDEGKKVKVTRKIKRVLVKNKVNHVVAERMGWAKFGAEKGKKPGPDTATTTVGENVRLKLTVGGLQKDEPEEDESAALRQQLAGRKITCRLCQGDHYTTRCPYKDTLGDVLGAGGDEGEEGGAEGAALTGQTASDLRAAGKYVPPSQRAGAASRVGESMHMRDRDSMPTLRVTNLSEDCTDRDMWDLFGRFGRVVRIYLGKDQETGLCKGFAFVSYETKKEAEDAMGKINGLPYDHLILSCTWSVPKGQEGTRP
ncbi:translation initiation factor eIF3 subunit g [Microbotryomycetes sp. JL221]|nr:translation initiation factor eIF3 subunit g [Microbotryomycetes sp. JL221]